MSTRTHLTVGYDGSPDALAALRWAGALAARRSQDIQALTVVDPRETPRGVAWPDSWWEELERDARHVMDEFPGVSLTFARRGGHLVPTLVEASRDASMLVVGSRGHNALGELMLGSVSQGAARHAVIPVVVVRPVNSREPGRIVVGSDGSASSHRAVEFACELAATSGDKLVVLHAWHPDPLVADRYGYAPPVAHESAEHAEVVLDRLVDELRSEHPALDIVAEAYRGAAETALVDASWNASMVVVGSRGHSAFAHLVMGSVSHDVLHQAHCPVAVVP